MIKVLVVVKTLALGGVGSVIFAYYDAIRNQRITDIHMDFAAGNPIEKRYMDEIEAGGSKLFITNKDKNPISYVRQIEQIVRNGHYEIVHVHGNSALITPDLFGAMLGGARKRIAHSHNTTCDNLRLNALMRPVFNMLYTDALACGKDAGYWMFGNKSFIVLKNGIELDKYKFCSITRKKIRQELGVGDATVLGHVGSFNYQKNHELLIKIFEEYHRIKPDTVLLLVGDGETKASIEEQTKKYELEDSVIFYGASDNVLELLMAMDCFLLPSRFEGLPCAIVEAQATGLPCVVSDKVSPEAKMSEHYRSVCIDKGTSYWCSEIVTIGEDERKLCSEQNCSVLRNKGYDINAAVNQLIDIYFDTPRRM